MSALSVIDAQWALFGEVMGKKLATDEQGARNAPNPRALHLAVKAVRESNGQVGLYLRLYIRAPSLPVQASDQYSLEITNFTEEWPDEEATHPGSKKKKPTVDYIIALTHALYLWSLRYPETARRLRSAELDFVLVGDRTTLRSGLLLALCGCTVGRCLSEEEDIYAGPLERSLAGEAEAAEKKTLELGNESDLRSVVRVEVLWPVARRGFVELMEAAIGTHLSPERQIRGVTYLRSERLRYSTNPPAVVLFEPSVYGERLRVLTASSSSSSSCSSAGSSFSTSSEEAHVGINNSTKSLSRLRLSFVLQTSMASGSSSDLYSRTRSECEKIVAAVKPVAAFFYSRSSAEDEKNPSTEPVVVCTALLPLTSSTSASDVNKTDAASNEKKERKGTGTWPCVAALRDLQIYTRNSRDAAETHVVILLTDAATSVDYERELREVCKDLLEDRATARRMDPDNDCEAAIALLPMLLEPAAVLTACMLKRIWQNFHDEFGPLYYSLHTSSMSEWSTKFDMLARQIQENYGVQNVRLQVFNDPVDSPSSAERQYRFPDEDRADEDDGWEEEDDGNETDDDRRTRELQDEMLVSAYGGIRGDAGATLSSSSRRRHVPSRWLIFPGACRETQLGLGAATLLSSRIRRFRAHRSHEWTRLETQSLRPAMPLPSLSRSATWVSCPTSSLPAATSRETPSLEKKNALHTVLDRLRCDPAAPENLFTSTGGSRRLQTLPVSVIRKLIMQQDRQLRLAVLTAASETECRGRLDCIAELWDDLAWRLGHGNDSKSIQCETVGEVCVSGARARLAAATVVRLQARLRRVAQHLEDTAVEMMKVPQDSSRLAHWGATILNLTRFEANGEPLPLSDSDTKWSGTSSSPLSAGAPATLIRDLAARFEEHKKLLGADVSNPPEALRSYLTDKTEAEHLTELLAIPEKETEQWTSSDLHLAAGFVGFLFEIKSYPKKESKSDALTPMFRVEHVSWRGADSGSVAYLRLQSPAPGARPLIDHLYLPPASNNAVRCAWRASEYWERYMAERYIVAQEMGHAMFVRTLDAAVFVRAVEQLRACTKPLAALSSSSSSSNSSSSSSSSSSSLVAKRQEALRLARLALTLWRGLAPAPETQNDLRRIVWDSDKWPLSDPNRLLLAFCAAPRFALACSSVAIASAPVVYPSLSSSPLPVARVSADACEEKKTDKKSDLFKLEHEVRVGVRTVAACARAQWADRGAKDPVQTILCELFEISPRLQKDARCYDSYDPASVHAKLRCFQSPGCEGAGGGIREALTCVRFREFLQQYGANADTGIAATDLLDRMSEALVNFFIGWKPSVRGFYAARIQPRDEPPLDPEFAKHLPPCSRRHGIEATAFKTALLLRTIQGQPFDTVLHSSDTVHSIVLQLRTAVASAKDMLNTLSSAGPAKIKPLDSLAPQRSTAHSSSSLSSSPPPSLSSSPRSSAASSTSAATSSLAASAPLVSRLSAGHISSSSSWDKSSTGADFRSLQTTEEAKASVEMRAHDMPQLASSGTRPSLLRSASSSLPAELSNASRPSVTFAEPLSTLPLSAYTSRLLARYPPLSVPASLSSSASAPAGLQSHGSNDDSGSFFFDPLAPPGGPTPARMHDLHELPVSSSGMHALVSNPSSPRVPPESSSGSPSSNRTECVASSLPYADELIRRYLGP